MKPEVKNDWNYTDLALSRYILKKSTEATLWIDAEGNFIFANSSAEGLLGYCEAELGEMIITDITPTGTHGPTSVNSEAAY